LAARRDRGAPCRRATRVEPETRLHDGDHPDRPHPSLTQRRSREGVWPPRRRSEGTGCFASTSGVAPPSTQRMMAHLLDIHVVGLPSAVRRSLARAAPRRIRTWSPNESGSPRQTYRNRQ
jgi:hypothetical protein